ncbi:MULTISPECIES: glutathione S-transferase family protein [Bordetella]|uniref:Glutathione S-transferase n=2 Tax=Bordetella TaxID=517 RepID=A0A261W2D3_9BORD|nr:MULTISPECIES: glutathione binding-like protein [Bordetella]MDM9558771.1 glutathione binding-like protein [Bordetella petrii]OZI80020.1 glutathione S-transferase [Bordetella genomosp. 2]
MPTDTPLTFYTADTPNGHKIAIYLHEAALPHRQVTLDLGRGDQRRPEFLAINPNGKIPAIVDHAAGLTVFESGAILSYLAAHYGCLQPAGAAEQWQVQQWLHFQIGGIGPMLGQLWWFLHASDSGNREAIERYTREALRLCGVVERRLEASAYLALDRYSIADIAAFPWLRTHAELRLDLAPYPRLRDWLQRIEARPAVRQALAAARDDQPAQA